jgi:hypothetical protein
MRRVPVVVSVLVSGVLFGTGLTVSRMVVPEVVLDFLLFRDFGLLLVLCSALLVTLLTYQLAPRVLRKPWFAPAFEQRSTETSRRDTVIGAALFGIGWGISGVCPGPALASMGAGNWRVGIALAGIFVGAYVQGRLARRPESGSMEAP